MEPMAVIILIMSFGVLMLCIGYWMGRNSAGLPVSQQPIKQKPSNKKYTYADEDPYTKAMAKPVKTNKVFDEERITTIDGDK